MASDTASCLQIPKWRNVDTVSLVLPTQPPRLHSWGGFPIGVSRPLQRLQSIHSLLSKSINNRELLIRIPRPKKKIPLHLLNPGRVRVPGGQGSLMCRLVYTSARCSLPHTPLSPPPRSLNEQGSRSDMSTENQNSYQKKGNWFQRK